ncbi:hypothetical protein NXX12_21440 [Phocaeicola vulgatus]|uniref:hypothetical protein n=1 Tax=Phocaeicola vulgatus TaxID=821 RepID=UPI002165B740|nr:hypothetical protein [Phocaeicola vulgatus]MCS3022751.1 hypothetical protein [Phocaeicola vulgatus]
MKPLKMQPFQKLTYYIKKDNITKEWLRNIKYKNGSFQFTNLPLKQLIETINSRYNSNIKLEGINLKQQSAFTGKNPLRRITERCLTENLL